MRENTIWLGCKNKRSLKFKRYNLMVNGNWISDQAKYEQVEAARAAACDRVDDALVRKWNRPRPPRRRKGA